ncbi:MAG TPA: RHS repeat-associated core domain-containing protein, partial [Stellaceae bacterium]|nr:RHS repeat-associated core domain-containing protein [Stellaceae bacterium]
APQRITDGGQNLVWDAAFTPFGEVAQLTPGVTENLRFPGQYADAETGVNYNFFRDYDPTVGRYVESDPIGLAGGINTFSYVLANPVGWLDEYGLAIGDNPPLSRRRAGLRQSRREPVLRRDPALCFLRRRTALRRSGRAAPARLSGPAAGVETKS